MNNADKPIHPKVNSNKNFNLQVEEIYTDKNNIGLTKMEYFAGLAMQGLISSFTEKASNGSWGVEIKETIIVAIEYADEILKQLETTQD